VPYQDAWQLIKAGNYDEDHLADIEDVRIAERRLNDLRAGRSKTHSLDEEPVGDLSLTQLRNSAIAATTVCCSSSRSSGKMGSASTSRAARSASGNAPSP
jgi:hypothetical protein